MSWSVVAVVIVCVVVLSPLILFVGFAALAIVAAFIGWLVERES